MSNVELVVCEHCHGKGLACRMTCPCCLGQKMIEPGAYTVYMKRVMITLIRMGRNMLEAKQAKSNTSTVGTYHKGREVPLPVTS